MPAPKAIVVLPVREHINAELRSALDACGIPWLPVYGCSDLPRARSHLLTQALATGAERVVCIDADIVASADQIKSLAFHKRVTGMRAVTGRYSVRAGTAWAVGKPSHAAPDGCRMVPYAGLGFACVSSSSLQRVADQEPSITDDNFGTWWPFCIPLYERDLADPKVARYYADDYSLWIRLNRTSTTLWCDPKLIVGHQTTMTLMHPLKPSS